MFQMFKKYFYTIFLFLILCAPLHAAVLSPTILGSSLNNNVVSNWPLDNHILDIFSSNNGTASNATSDTDNKKIGLGSYSFNGTTASITIDNESNFDFLTVSDPTFSIGLWFKTTDASFELITKNDQSAPIGLEFRGRSGFLDLTLVRNAGNLVSLRGDTSIDDDIWHHAVWIIENEISTLYIDNSIESLTDNGAGNYFGGGGANNKPVLFGARFNGASKEMFYAGLLDEIIIWNIALTSTEVSLLYNIGYGKPIQKNIVYPIVLGTN